VKETRGGGTCERKGKLYTAEEETKLEWGFFFTELKDKKKDPEKMRETSLGKENTASRGGNELGGAKEIWGSRRKREPIPRRKRYRIIIKGGGETKG